VPLSDEQRAALEAKVSLIRRDRDRAAAHDVAAVKRAMAARGLFASSHNLMTCWEAIRAHGLTAGTAMVETCVDVGMRDVQEIYEYVKADFLLYLRSFNEAEALGSPSATAGEAQLRLQAETEGARFYDEARSMVFDAKAAGVAAPPATAVAAPPPAAGSGIGQWVHQIEGHAIRKVVGWVAVTVTLGTLGLKACGVLPV
jgi:hypothetical protein